MQNTSDALRSDPRARFPFVGNPLFLGMAVFVSSAILMLVEIAAGRLLAPYVGVSLYSWTAIIGVILGGLSLGNWLGGIWADREGGTRAVGITLLASAVACAASLVILTFVAPVLQNAELGLLSTSFLYVALLFFLPAVLLGTATPLLITLALQADTRTGRTVGRMHALAALGSIVGTFATGYWLVQTFGTVEVILGAAGVLVLLGLPFLRGQSPAIAVTALAVGLLVTWTGGGRGAFANPCDVESSYFCIRVEDASESAPFGEARAMVLDHLEHGINHADDPTLLLTPYAHLMDELIQAQFGGPAQRYFFAGGGAYTLPRALRAEHPQADIVVAEIDPIVTLIAQAGMFVTVDGMRIAHTDARVAIQREKPGYFDVVLTDAFHDLSVPYHLLTEEFARQVAARLGDNGVYLINLVDVRRDPQLVAAVHRTLARVFPQVRAWMAADTDEESRTTYVLIAGRELVSRDLLQARRGMPRVWQEWQLSTSAAEQLVLRDNYVPVEKLIAPIVVGRAGR